VFERLQEQEAIAEVVGEIGEVAGVADRVPELGVQRLDVVGDQANAVDLRLDRRLEHLETRLEATEARLPSIGARPTRSCVIHTQRERNRGCRRVSGHG
jgi:hypothetical protein